MGGGGDVLIFASERDPLSGHHKTTIAGAHTLITDQNIWLTVAIIYTIAVFMKSVTFCIVYNWHCKCESLSPQQMNKHFMHRTTTAVSHRFQSENT